MMAEQKRIGWPPRKIPEPIDDTPENIACALVNTPPKRESEWKYLKAAKRKPRR